MALKSLKTVGSYGRLSTRYFIRLSNGTAEEISNQSVSCTITKTNTTQDYDVYGQRGMAIIPTMHDRTLEMSGYILPNTNATLVNALQGQVPFQVIMYQEDAGYFESGNYVVTSGGIDTESKIYIINASLTLTGQPLQGRMRTGTGSETTSLSFTADVKENPTPVLIVNPSSGLTAVTLQVTKGRASDTVAFSPSGANLQILTGDALTLVASTDATISVASRAPTNANDSGIVFGVGYYYRLDV